MRKTAVYAAVSIMLSLLYTASLFGLQQSVVQNVRRDKQLTLREVISPESAQIELHELFRINGPALEEAQSHGQDSGQNHGQNTDRVKGFKIDMQPFGRNPAFIPFWQLSALIKEEIRTEKRAIVGRGSFYLPPQLSRVEKSVSMALLGEIKERENFDDIRVELELSPVPEKRIESRIDSTVGSLRSNLRAELITDSGDSLRFALYAESAKTSGVPIAVVQAGVHRYVQGYSAVDSMRKGDAVTAERVEPAPVPLAHTGSRGNYGEGVSLAGLDSGYEYTLKRDVEAGELIKPSYLKITPPVERGDRLLCRFEKGSLILTLDGRAVSSGGIGDMVRVHLSTGKYRELQVTGKGEVRINLSGSEG